MILVLIETDEGEIVSEFSLAGYLGACKEEWLRPNSYKIIKASIKSLPFYLTSTEYEHFLPIGSVEFMKKSAEILGFELPKPLNIPNSLRNYCGRNVWESSFENVSFPCFLKPADDVKLFTGFVANSIRDFSLYPELKGFKGNLFCSEPIEEIISEWRCFVLKGKVVNCSNYYGDSLVFPNRQKIELLISKYYDAPLGYSLDVCVNNKETQLIEVNDGWALGNYGCDPQDYFNILKSRWIEIVKNKEDEKE